MAVGPQPQRRLRRAERRRPVDGGAAADVAPLQDHDRQVVGGAVAVLLVQRRVGPGLLHVEVGARVVAAFFEHGDLGAGLGEHRGRDAAARAAADDDVVDLERRRRGQLGARDEAARAAARVAHGGLPRRHRRHHGRPRIADERVDLGRRVVRRVRQPLQRLVAAAQQREARAPPGFEARVLLVGRGARERPRRAGDERAQEAALEQAQQAAEVTAHVRVDGGHQRVDLARAVQRRTRTATACPACRRARCAPRPRPAPRIPRCPAAAAGGAGGARPRVVRNANGSVPAAISSAPPARPRLRKRRRSSFRRCGRHAAHAEASTPSPRIGEGGCFGRDAARAACRRPGRSAGSST